MKAEEMNEKMLKNQGGLRISQLLNAQWFQT